MAQGKRLSGGEIMVIRRGEERDLIGIGRLLGQVLAVHHNGRPDLFKGDTKKPQSRITSPVLASTPA